MPAESEVHFRAIFEDAAIGIALVNEDGYLLDANPALERITGYSRAELCRMRFAEFTHPDDVEQDQRLYRELMAGQREHYTLEKRYIRKDGCLAWVHLSVSLIRGSGGVPDYAVGMAIDMTERKQAEVERDRLIAILEATPDFVATADVDGNVRYYNRAARRLLEIGQDEDISGIRIPETHPQWAQEIVLKQAIPTAIHTGGWRGETAFLSRSGREIPVSQVILAHREPGGDVEFLSTVARDMTQQKQAEEEKTALLAQVQNERERLSILYETAHAVIEMRDPAQFLETVLSRVLAHLAADAGSIYLRDHKPDQLGLAAHQGFSAQNLAFFTEHGLGDNSITGQVAACGKPLLIEDLSTYPYSDEAHQILRRDGFVSHAAIPLCTSTEIIGVLNVVWRTHRRLDSEALSLLEGLADILTGGLLNARLLAQVQAQAQQLQHIMDTVSEGLVLLDGEQRVLSANAAAIDYLALLADAEMGERLTQLADRPIAQFLEPPPQDTLAHEVTVSEPVARIFEVTAHAMDANTGTAGLLLVLVDVTEKRQIQERIQLQDRLAAVGQLAAGIAHDFNNILGVIILQHEMLRRTADLSVQNRERLDMIDQQVQQAINLIRQILDFSRRSVMHRSPINLLPFLKEVMKLWQRTFPENIKFDLAYDRTAYMVNADPGRLQQALTNLAVNARDAMPNGGCLGIELTWLDLPSGQKPPVPEMKPGPWLRLAVTDTGRGIPASVLPHIFEPFYTTKERGKGTGLGLAQVHGIIKQHDGHIRVESREGAGTTFTIYLPLKAVETDAPVVVSDATPVSSGGNETILIVEDEAALRVTLQETLQAWGYRVLTAANGREGLIVLTEQSERVDLVLCDLVMPEMGGRTFCRVLRETWPEVKVIVMTGYPQADEADLRQTEGVEGFLQKPISNEQLARTVRSVLKSGWR